MTFKQAKSKPTADKPVEKTAKSFFKTDFSSFNWLYKDVLILSSIGLACFLFLVFYSYHPDDPGFESVTAQATIANYGGRTGAWLSSFILYLFGVFGLLIPFGLFMTAMATFKLRSGNTLDLSHFFLSLLGLFFLIASGAGLSALYLNPDNSLIQLPYSGGGVLGYELSARLVSTIDLLGATLVFLVVWAISFSLFTNFSWLTIVEVTGSILYKLFEFLTNQMQSFQSDLAEKRAEKTGARQTVRQENQHFSREPSHEASSKEATGVIKPLITAVTGQKNKVVTLLTELTDKKTKPGAVGSSEPQILSEPKIVTDKQPKINVTQAQGSVEQSSSSSLENYDVKVGQKEVANTSLPVVESGELPSVELLDPIPEYEEGFSEETLKNLSFMVEQSLEEFGVKVKVESVQPGPVVTRFEVLPAPGVKVSQISNLSKDLARVMSLKSVRVVDIIPGKSVVGIEIPNEEREVVSFREVISSDEFQNSVSPLTIGLGKDIAGKSVVADIGKMPHLLVAGTTGSGKSVGINSMILSLLYKSTPEEVRMIMIDPKMLELSIYEDIPHLLTPVVTDMSDAANALRWCVVEMDRRYALMAKLGVRNIAGYNAKVKGAIKDGKPIIDPLYQQVANFGLGEGEKPRTLEALPYIVVVVDEFADMIMVVGKEVEQLIARIAQKARAAGIHLILATQRPSVNVITGLIKANIPTRISFMVNTKIDSRTILDQGGAEQLLGMGDMLFMPPGSGSPRRVHGAYMTDDEVHRVAAFVKSQGAPQYLPSITQGPSSDESDLDDDADAEQDKLYDEVVEFVVDGRRVSVSSVQRRFSIGFNRAARIVEAMERSGIVSPMRSNGNREVLIPKSDV